MEPQPQVRITRSRMKNDQLLIREVVRVSKTPSFNETFAGRLNWKIRHYDKPVTSTPVANDIKTSRVLRNIAAHDNIDSSIISPIKKDDVLQSITVTPAPAQAKNSIPPIQKDDVQSTTVTTAPAAQAKSSTSRIKKNDVQNTTVTTAPAAQAKSSTSRIKKNDVYNITATPQAKSSIQPVEKATVRFINQYPPAKVSHQPAPHITVPLPALATSNDSGQAIRKTRAKNRQGQGKGKRDTAAAKRKKIDTAAEEWAKKINEEFEAVDEFALCVE